MSEWASEIKRYSEGSQRLLVGNKSDSVERCQISTEAAQQFAKSHGMDYTETSALNSNGVEDAFTKLARSLMLRKKVVQAVDNKKLGQLHKRPMSSCC